MDGLTWFTKEPLVSRRCRLLSSLVRLGTSYPTDVTADSLTWKGFLLVWLRPLGKGRQSPSVQFGVKGHRVSHTCENSCGGQNNVPKGRHPNRRVLDRITPPHGHMHPRRCGTLRSQRGSGDVMTGPGLLACRWVVSTMRRRPRGVKREPEAGGTRPSDGGRSHQPRDVVPPEPGRPGHRPYPPRPASSQETPLCGHLSLSPPPQPSFQIPGLQTCE